MSDPRPMIETEDGLGGLLLASADRDAPSSQAKSRAARALGIGVAASVGSAIGSGLAHGASKAAGASATAAASKGSLLAGLSVSKWIMVAALGGGTTLAVNYGIEASREQPRRNDVSERMQTPPVVAPAALVQERQPEPAPVAAPDLAPADQATDGIVQAEEEGKSASPTRSKSQVVTSAPPLGIAEELELIEQARSQSGLVALETLARYGSRFPQGVLRPEALALEIVTRRALGQSERAETLMERLQTRYPRSPLLEGLRLQSVEAP